MGRGLPQLYQYEIGLRVESNRNKNNNKTLRRRTEERQRPGLRDFVVQRRWFWSTVESSSNVLCSRTSIQYATCTPWHIVGDGVLARKQSLGMHIQQHQVRGIILLGILWMLWMFRSCAARVGDANVHKKRQSLLCWCQCKRKNMVGLPANVGVLNEARCTGDATYLNHIDWWWRWWGLWTAFVYLVFMAVMRGCEWFDFLWESLA